MKWTGREYWHYDVKTYYWEDVGSTDAVYIPLGGGIIEGDGTSDPSLADAKEYFVAPYSGEIVKIVTGVGGSTSGNIAYTFHKDASASAVGSTYTTASFSGTGGGVSTTVYPIDWQFDMFDKIFIKANPNAAKHYYNCTIVYKYIIT